MPCAICVWRSLCLGFEVLRSSVYEDIRLLAFNAMKSGRHGIANTFSLAHNLQGRRPRPFDMSLTHHLSN